MKVVYDVSILGAYSSPDAPRAGIARVAESVMQGLLQQQDCDMSLSALFNGPETHAYLKASGLAAKLLDPDLRPGVSGAAHGRLRRVAEELRRRYQQRRFALRIAGWADVFHSSHFPLPPFSRRARTARFITLYDMIPALTPEVCTPRTQWQFRQRMRSITRDTWVLAISENTKRDFCERQMFDPARVFVTPIAAARDLFRPVVDMDVRSAVRRKYGIPNEPYALSLCTLEPRKNLPFVMECFARLVETEGLADLNLVLAGSSGWHTSDLAGAFFAKHPNLRKRVIVTGRVADEDLSALYSAAEMFVYMSLYEGFGLPPLEAMQCGTPVIVSNTSSLPEVVGEAGVLLDPRDADGLCQAILHMHRDAALRGALAAKAVTRAATFSWERCMAETMRAYGVAVGVGR
jgi:glycosyltransferase involved in cell wall biosynthesis